MVTARGVLAGIVGWSDTLRSARSESLALHLAAVASLRRASSAPPRLGKNIGYAMLALPWTNLGTDLMVESPNAERAATVVENLFVDPKKTMARSP